MLQKGQIFNNRYKIISILGQGGFGAVYKVWDDNLQRHCAIKENLQVSAEAQKQFKREAIMLANLNHPNLVRVTDYFFIADRGQYLVMDFVDGNDLETILTDNGGPLPTEQALAWIRQVCDALIYIHNQNPPIIHRDIKPGNIRVTPQGNAVLVDFGLAKSFDVGMQTSMGARGLTPHFAAPEQYGIGGTDAQSDIYSLGVTLYCLLTCSVPPDSVEIMVGNADPPSPAREIRSNISDSVSDALQTAMQIRRTKRFKSVTDFKNALIASQAVQIVSPSYLQARVATAANKFTHSNMEFEIVPAGKFFMGSNNGRYNEKPQHKVELAEYLIGKYPVTNLEYQAFVRDAKYKAPKDWMVDQFPEKKGNHPVSHVSWFDATAFCNWLSQKTGEQYRLPTEAEWEKAARGIDGREYPWGDVFDPKKANTEESDIDNTTDVGKFSPQGDSPYGCADMAGNVWEWVNDWYSDTYYESSPSSNPLGPDSGELRILRGGSWNHHEVIVRSSSRSPKHPHYAGHISGFRVVVSTVLPPSVIKIDKSDSQNNPTYHNKPSLFSNGIEFMHVPAGKFLMGSDNNLGEEPQHTVELSEFYISKYPVTNLEYQAFVDDAKYKAKYEGPQFWYHTKKGKQPVVGVSWHDANAFCQWMSQKTGKQFRLPTEAEWEKAARGTDGRIYPWGDVFDPKKANNEESFNGINTDVGIFSPQGDSPYGCADMASNVWEWCNDWHSSSYYKSSPSLNPPGPDSGYDRVLRGGFWDLFDLIPRCALRGYSSPNTWADYIGFRLVSSRL